MEYEIHTMKDGGRFVLKDTMYPKSFEGFPARNPRRFSTRGGARNYARKWSIRGALIVPVPNEGTKP